MQYEIIILGVIITTFFYEFTGISPGGIVVPSYFALYLNNPQRITYTIFLGVASALIVKFLSNHIILYGRRKFTMCIVVSFLLGIIIKYININLFMRNNIYIIDDKTIGIIISGILANEMEKNGILKIIPPLFIVAIFISSLSQILKR